MDGGGRGERLAVPQAEPALHPAMVDGGGARAVALIRPTLAVGDTLEATVRALSRTGAVSRVSVVTGRGGERMDGDGSKTG